MPRLAAHQITIIAKTTAPGNESPETKGANGSKSNGVVAAAAKIEKDLTLSINVSRRLKRDTVG